jgi:hypothetical protein
MLVLLAGGFLAGRSTATVKPLDVSDGIRERLEQAGFKDASVTGDRDKGIVTVGGQIASTNAKSDADAKPLALKSGVVTLNGEVNSEDKRTCAGHIATEVPNVHHVRTICRSRITKCRKC